jgi:imidazolonepropionase-like amidohydrolase
MPSVFRGILATIMAMQLAAVPLGAQPTQPRPPEEPLRGKRVPTALFQNVRIFNGTNGQLSAPAFVLVRGNTIEAISATPIATDRRADTVLIDGAGRTLMPGLIDAHWHTMLVRPTPAETLVWDRGYASLVAGAEATDTLMRGFTTVRDLGGPSFGLKRAIDEGVVAGPAHLPVRRHHHRHQWSRRLPPAVRSAAHPRRLADAHGAARRQHGRRQSG